MYHTVHKRRVHGELNDMMVHRGTNDRKMEDGVKPLVLGMSGRLIEKLVT